MNTLVSFFLMLVIASVVSKISPCLSMIVIMWFLTGGRLGFVRSTVYWQYRAGRAMSKGLRRFYM